jgi:hypothetical protein
VTPTGLPLASRQVMTVTPVANWAKQLRRARVISVDIKFLQNLIDI